MCSRALPGLRLLALICSGSCRTRLVPDETVLSGSMKPEFSPGDIVVVTPERTRDVRVGQVISYPSRSATTTCRATGDRGRPRWRPPARADEGRRQQRRRPMGRGLDGTTGWQVAHGRPEGRLGDHLAARADHPEATIFIAPLCWPILGLWRIWRARQRRAG
jgi:hypothetical protein